MIEASISGADQYGNLTLPEHMGLRKERSTPVLLSAGPLNGRMRSSSLLAYDVLTSQLLPQLRTQQTRLWPSAQQP